MKQIPLKLATIVLTLIVGLAAVLWFSKSSNSKGCIDAQYFPEGAFSKREGRLNWITEFYSAMQEQPLSCLHEDVEAYRFLFLPSFEPPASIRVWREGDRKYIELRQLSSIGSPQNGAKDMRATETRALTEKEWRHLLELLEKANFWSMPTEDEKPIGLGNASFLLEGKKPRQYHVVDRWFPEDQNFLNACDYLFEISRLVEIKQQNKVSLMN